MQATAGTFKAIFALNTLSNTIRNQNQKLLITITPRQFLMDGYENTVIASMKQLGGMAKEDEDPTGRFALMMTVCAVATAVGCGGV